MKKLSAKVLAAAALVTVGVFAVPQSAMAVPQSAMAGGEIDRCQDRRPAGRTSYQVSCHDSNWILSDAYNANIVCNGITYSSSYELTPFATGWGPWAKVSCPAGQTWTRAWWNTVD